VVRNLSLSSPAAPWCIRDKKRDFIVMRKKVLYIYYPITILSIFKMKKLTCILAVTLAAFTFQAAHSQTPVYLGAKGGISIPNLTSGSAGTNDWNEGYSSRIATNIGILAEFQLSDHFSLQPETNYIGEGGKRKGLQPFPIPDEYLDLFQQGLHTDKDYICAT